MFTLSIIVVYLVITLTKITEEVKKISEVSLLNSFGKYFLKRIFFMIITLWLIATITFFLMQLLPGTPYTNQEKLSPETIAMLNKQSGLDKPVIVQYGIYLKNLVTGDFGISFQFKNQPVAKLLAGRIGPSLQLGGQAIIFGTLVGILLGIIAAMRQNTWVDTLATLLAILGRSKLCFRGIITIHFCNEIKNLTNCYVEWFCIHNLANYCLGNESNGRFG